MILNADSYCRIFDNLYDGLYIVDRDRVIRYWNRAAERISGFAAAEVVGKSCADNILTHVDSAGTNLCQGTCPLAQTITDGSPREVGAYLHHKAGHRIPVSIRVTPLNGFDGAIIGGIELFTDMSSFTSIDLRLRELEALALIDSLTRLPNRTCMQKEFFVRLEERKRLRVPFGILFMDIDHFKTFNDRYGHDVGDRVLQFVAETLTVNSRPFDLIGRWGGEEFLGIIRNVNEEQLADIGTRLRVLVKSSYITHGDSRINISISVGATMVRDDDTFDTALKRADVFLYESKNKGRNILTIG